MVVVQRATGTCADALLVAPCTERHLLQLRKRRIRGVDHNVEAREMDDWMVVDAGNIIVNIMDAGAAGGAVSTVVPLSHAMPLMPIAHCHASRQN